MREKYKPLSFSTTLRNPERIGELLLILNSYDKKIMTNNLCYKIYTDFIKYKTVYPQKAISENGWKDKYNNFSFSKDELNTILYDYDNSHKEAGFEAGKPSRVDTYLKLIKEMGFMYYAPNEEIIINKTGLEYLNAYETGDVLSMQKLFMNALINFQTNTPYRKNLAKFRPAPLLFNVIDEIENMLGTDYILKEEIPLIICSKNNDYNFIVSKIIEFRKCSDLDQKKEAIYKYIISEYGYSEKYIKYERIFIEATDDFIRKFRFAGLIDIKGTRYIKVNTLIQSIKENIKELNNSFITEQDLFSYNQESSKYNLFVFDLFETMEPTSNKANTQDWVKLFEKNNIDIDKEIMKLTSSRKSKIKLEVLSHLADSLLLEFLYVLKLSREYPYINVYGNYGANEEGVPMFHAPGGNPDIVLDVPNDNNAIVEVTLLGGRNQLQQELLPISRHLSEYKRDNENAYCWYISRVIHDDIVRYSKFIKYDEDLDIYLSSISQSIAQINNSQNSYAMLKKIIKH